ncbi:exodeoxyribonuclease VII large subunit [Alloiococcus sp. CFN-8]|uniref:exodeoxyribonuclease VII large subunit n=1 Tax=Alloiococcus sp. CFN-8 TaxID=3416081 RepID=UPI003CF9838A
MQIKILSVSELNNYIKRTIDNDFILNNIRVQGEISNLKYHSSGHIYFSLKDEGSKINCIMFRSNAEAFNILLKDGRKVEVKGRVSVYHRDGSYQIYCNSISDIGLGELYEKFNLLKEKLSKKGFFDIEAKKSLPLYPFKIGVVTSPTGAAVKDIINVITRRNPSIELLIYPALVQGDGSVASLIKGIKVLDSRDDIDIIIIARGGGSIEELWSFNSEELAEAIYNANKPIVSGVGHETDFTICDFVADIRAATPSQAAEISAVSLESLIDSISMDKEKITSLALRRIEDENYNLILLERLLENFNPMNIIIHKYEEIALLKDTLNKNINMAITNNFEQIKALIQLLEAHNPLNVLKKGYSIIFQKDKLINSVAAFKFNESTEIIFKDGKVEGLIVPTEEERK